MYEPTCPEDVRYTRQLLMPEIGPHGQARLSQAAVLVVGTGGLGSPALFYLAAAGVGRLGLVDNDQVELSNLNRQILHTTAELGVDKVTSATRRLQALNPGVRLDQHRDRLTQENASSVIAPYELVIGAVDNLETRYLLNAACVAQRKPLIEAGVSGFHGMATTIIPHQTPCYNCLFPRGAGGPREPVYKGILGAVAGLMGTLEALEAIKFLLDQGRLLTGRLLVVDALTMELREIAVDRNPGCTVCGDATG